jgi:hypothetical protein
MKYLKLFEDYSSFDPSGISPEQRKIISDIVRDGFLVASENFSDELEKGFEVQLSTYEGAVDEETIEEREDSERIFNELADRIGSGENAGIIGAEPLNFEWDIRWGV